MVHLPEAEVPKVSAAKSDESPFAHRPFNRKPPAHCERDDRILLEQSYLALQPKERSDLEDTVKDNLLMLGMVVTKDAFHQYVLYETMRRTMYHHIRRHYPNMFSFDPVSKS